jgi:hypothetical protein
VSGLSINGVDLGSYAAWNGIERRDRAPVGERRLAFGGGERNDVSATKRGWRVRTKTLPPDVAEGLRVLVEGGDDGRTCDVVSFDVDTWSARGVPLSASSGNLAISSVSNVFGVGYGLYDNGNRLTYAEWSGMTPAGAPWTILAYRKDGPFSDLTHHYAATSTGLLYRDGAPNYSVPICITVDGTGKLIVNARDKQENLPTFQASHAYLVDNRISVVASNGFVYIFQVTVAGTSGGSAPTWPLNFNNTVSSGSPPVTWRNDGFGGLLVDDVVVLPFAAPASWLPQMRMNHSNPWVAPELKLEGSTVGKFVAPGATNASALARGRFVSGRSVKTKLYGSQGEQLELELREV